MGLQYDVIIHNIRASRSDGPRPWTSTGIDTRHTPFLFILNLIQYCPVTFIAIQIS